MNHCVFLGYINPSYVKELLNTETLEGWLVIVRFQLFISHKKKNDKREWENDYSYLPFTAFGDKTTSFIKFFKSGDKVLIEALVKQERYLDKNSEKLSRISFILKNFHFTSQLNTKDGNDERKEESNTTYDNISASSIYDETDYEF